MMRRFQSILICLSLAFASGAASADSGWFLDPVRHTNDHELIARLLLPQDTEPAQQTLSLRAGYRFTSSFSVRALLRDFVFDPAPGEICNNADFVCMAARRQAAEFASGYTVSLIPSLALHDDLSVYGHLGLRDWNVEANGDPSVRRSEILFGIGVGYDISNPLRLQLDYRSMDLDIKLTSIGFTWRF